MPSIHHCIMRRRASSPLQFCPTLTVLLHRSCPGKLHSADSAVSDSTPLRCCRRQTSTKAKCRPQTSTPNLRQGEPATGGPATGGLQQQHPAAAAPGGSASAAGPNRGLTRRALAASALTELTTSFSAPPSWFSMFKPLSSSATTQRAHPSCPSSSNLTQRSFPRFSLIKSCSISFVRNLCVWQDLHSLLGWQCISLNGIADSNVYTTTHNRECVELLTQRDLSQNYMFA